MRGDHGNKDREAIGITDIRAISARSFIMTFSISLSVWRSSWVLGALPTAHVPLVLPSAETIIPYPRDCLILVLSAFVCSLAADSSRM
jgi:hypothetical protein